MYYINIHVYTFKFLASGYISNSTFRYNSAVSGGAMGIYDGTCVECCPTSQHTTNIFIGNSGEKDICYTANFPLVHQASSMTQEEALIYLETLYDQRNFPSYQARKLADQIIYVDARVDASGNCITWETACKTIQEGLDIGKMYHESYDERVELWIVGGKDITYYPTVVPDWYNKSASYYNAQKSKLIEVYEHIGIFGGFNGSEINRKERNWYKNPTFINGKLDDNTQVYQVMHVRDEAWVDGVLIYNGYGLVTLSSTNDDNGDDNGDKKEVIESRSVKQRREQRERRKMQPEEDTGSMSITAGGWKRFNDIYSSFWNDGDNRHSYSDSYSHSSSDNTNGYGSTNPNDVLYSQVPTRGSSIFANSSCTIVNSLLYSSFAFKGAGLYVLGNTVEDHIVTAINVGFINNAASLRGGGTSIDLYGYLDCDYCLYENNIVRYKGGGVYSDFNAQSQFNHSQFINNYAYDSGGALAVDGAGYSVLNHVAITNNYAFNEGAGLYCGSFDPFDEPNYFRINQTSVKFKDNSCQSGGDNWFLYTYDYVKFLNNESH